MGFNSGFKGLMTTMPHLRKTEVIFIFLQHQICWMKFFHYSVYCSFTQYCWQRIFIYKTFGDTHTPQKPCKWTLSAQQETFLTCTDLICMRDNTRPGGGGGGGDSSILCFSRRDITQLTLLA